MMGAGSPIDNGHVAGFEAPMHRALAEPILLGGAPRAIAIVNGTVAAALGLGLQQWIAGILLWAVGHTLAVFAAKRDPDRSEEHTSELQSLMRSSYAVFCLKKKKK